MRLLSWILTISVLVLLWPHPALAQLPEARLTSLYPCGAGQGTTVRCTVAGADLEGLSGLDFSHRGITARHLESNRFEVTVAPDVPLGPYDVRAITARGLSNFRAFTVGDWPEVSEAESEGPQPLTLPVVVNGRIDRPTDVDAYIFSAKKGQRVLIDAWAERVDSALDATIKVVDPSGKEVAYSGDYVGKDPFVDLTAPQDGDYCVSIWDFVYDGGPDAVYRLQVGSLPHLDAVVPLAVRPGESTTLTLLGRNLPGGTPTSSEARPGQGGMLESLGLEDAFPTGVPSSTTLRGGQSIRPPQSTLDGLVYRLKTPSGSSNPIFLGVTEMRVAIEREPNDDRAKPQTLEVPSEVSGTFAPVGDADFYTFRAIKGQEVVVEVFGERQSGLIDPFLAGYDPSGRRIFSADDGALREIGQLRFPITTRDVRWAFRASTEGLYTVQIRDLYFQQRGEARFGYRLRVGPPRPDFRLFAVPSHDIHPDATTVGRGGRTWLDVLAFRNDNFDEPIRVEAHNLPRGVSCDPVVIGRGKTSVPLVFHAGADAPIGHAPVRITGTATIDGKEVTREARGGGLVWPTVNTPGIARMADSVAIAVRVSPPFTLAATAASAEVRAGGTLPIAVTLVRAPDWSGLVQLSGLDLPPGASVALASVAPDSTEAKVELVLPPKLRPGPYTFTIQGAGQVPRNYLVEHDPKKPRGNSVRAVFPSNPITITVPDPARPALGE